MTRGSEKVHDFSDQGGEGGSADITGEKEKPAGIRRQRTTKFGLHQVRASKGRGGSSGGESEFSTEKKVSVVGEWDERGGKLWGES